ncbi:hypothetical protein FB45DRAFT_939024 [Roridomyces roridus]|uniref:Uncharacterized protein n=1 Tax=Roridomyces roridus TaxID=1738132 RepID=A0AAD7B8P9_9AGAR|nr:hypothetical protein FB45DRAFT_939024 [Roridomyces roridus]
MVRVSSILILLTASMAANACKWCQCLKSDGSHCCLYTNGKDDTDCQLMCQQVHDSSGNNCGSNGALNYKCATLPECNDRSHCRESHACLA